MTTPSTLETPSLAPQHSAPRRPFGFRTALHAAGGALQWRLLLWWTLLLLLPAFVATLPVWQILSANLDYSVHAARLAERLDMLAIADLAGVARERQILGAGAIVALALTLLLSPLLSGMSVAAARAPQRLRFIPLLAAGAAEYGRMFRMLVWAAIPLALAGAASGAAFGHAAKVAGSAILETDAQQASRLALALTALLLVLVHASIDAGRALLGAEPRRRSACLAWWGGVKLLVRRPLAVLGSYLVITVAGLAVAALVALWRIQVPALGAGGTVAAFLLAQLAVLALGWMRGARLFALMALARDHAGR